MNWQSLPQLSGYAVEWADADGLLLSRRNRIYRTRHPLEKPTLVGEIPAPLWKRHLSHLRLAQRFLRFLVYNIVPLEDNTFFVSFAKEVGILEGGNFRFLEGIKRPARILRRGVARGSDGNIYWGEYLGNKERGPIYVYRYVPGAASAEVIYTFQPGEIRHVHGIYHDAQTDSLWCLVGDLPHECKFMRTRDGFQSLETVYGGDETWRAVSLIFTEDALYYGTDAEFRPNHLYRIDRASHERTMLTPVEGPIYYATSVQHHLFFAVTAELCPSQAGADAVLWHLDESTGDLQRLCAFPKDLLPLKPLVRLFMPGTLHFSSGAGDGQALYVTGVGLRALDNRVLRLSWLE